MTKYTSIQFAPDGDFITDYKADTVAEIEDICADQGSRWYFYPLPFVIRDPRPTQEILHMRIKAACHPFEYLIGKTVETARAEVIATEWEG